MPTLEEEGIRGIPPSSFEILFLTEQPLAKNAHARSIQARMRRQHGSHRFSFRLHTALIIQTEKINMNTRKALDPMQLCMGPWQTCRLKPSLKSPESTSKERNLGYNAQNVEQPEPQEQSPRKNIGLMNALPAATLGKNRKLPSLPASQNA